MVSNISKHSYDRRVQYFVIFTNLFPIKLLIEFESHKSANDNDVTSCECKNIPTTEIDDDNWHVVNDIIITMKHKWMTKTYECRY